MTSNNDNSNDQKLGGLRSNGGLDAGEGGNQTYDKGNAYAAASGKVCDTDKKGNECNDGKSGQYSNRCGQENQNQEPIAESGSTCGGSPRGMSKYTEQTVGVIIAGLDNFQARRRINGLIERQDPLVEARLSIMARELKVGSRKSSRFM